MSFFKSYNEISDVISAVVLCTEDTTLMLIADVNNELYIPFCKAPPSASWSKAISKDIIDIFGDIPPARVLRFNRIWKPPGNYVMHCVYLVQVNGDQKNKSKMAGGKYKGKIRWVSEAEITKFVGNRVLKSPEVYEYFFLAKNQAPPNYAQPEIVILKGNMLELTEDQLVTGKGDIMEVMVSSADISKNAQEALYKEFMTLSFPAIMLGVQSFTKLITAFGWSNDDGPHLFRAADIKRRGGVSFRDFLYLIAATDPRATFPGNTGEPRNLYIFRYYDKDGNNILNANEFRAFIMDTRKVRKLAVDAQSVAKEFMETYKLMNINEGQNIGQNEFIKAVKEQKFKGMLQMLRSQLETSKFIGERKSVVIAPGQSLSSESTRPIDFSDAGKSLSSIMKYKEYDLAVHTIKINKDNNQISVEQVFSVPDSASNTTLRRLPGTEMIRRNSIDVFNPKSVTNEVLKSLRYLTPLNKKLLSPTKNEKPTYTWGQLDSGTFIRHLINVSNQVKEIFRKEPRLLRLNSPLYVMGDLHGNVFDLLHFESTLWHLGATLCPCELLFLGDYVDRGPFSIEVIAYLFSYKLQCPEKVHLVRGNHEIRDVQKMFTFFGECILKCGEKLGAELWNSLNSAFDNMPVAAVVDGKIFCCHGGCPPPWLCPVITAINDIPVPLNQPNQQSSLAWEILWNDPVKPKQMNDKLSMELLANEGFAVNTRRGTAHMFSADALERFLKANKLTHLIRAHEVVQAGYYVQHKGKLVTVFSSSKYCGGDNEAACVMVDQSKLRILRLSRDSV